MNFGVESVHGSDTGTSADASVFDLMQIPATPDFVTQYPYSGRALKYLKAQARLLELIGRQGEDITDAALTGNVGLARTTFAELQDARERVNNLSEAGRLARIVMSVENLL